ncbi:2,4'-dihydroxyacetophenone dioxygenase family protein [Streptomyces sp. RS10V-4]|uniref:2,4'-dihydroxyacetophenone dioxygenase family protein n=1 Tax=Streptomyces rhizoryzae TaxID=2932493 RepID=UPI002002D37A|nr:2,4'-dihydroxyacetophenone dioxygenase family protein [Streptomyces rhizoryzae]MCK7626502.1 2,4'-dihydroxyacetophenone dioxygenase family protein [Streptomyces rhizoryzae]
MSVDSTPGADDLAATEARIDRRRDRYALPEGHIADAASPWLPFAPQVMIKHLTFDIRSNSAANVLWVQSGGSLGRHRHRGPVSGYVLEGSWRYREYDWVGRPGDFIRESPGRTHTLYSDEGMKTVFWLNGPVEFLDAQSRVTAVVDVFRLIDHYERGCQEQDIPINRARYL